jgi:hypothetical protein
MVKEIPISRIASSAASRRAAISSRDSLCSRFTARRATTRGRPAGVMSSSKNAPVL